MSQQRTPRQRPTSSPSPQSSRKVFNCIVDDTALVAGVKRSTRNGLRQWIKSGQIRLFVPLHALEQLSVQKNGISRHAEDVRETLEWLDQSTTRFPDAVTLQGGDETFQQWSEVEKFVVPRSLFSEQDHEDGHSLELELSNEVNDPTACSSQPTSSTRARSSLPSPPISPTKENDTEFHGVPVRLQPLFNYILWRIHQEIDPAAALESFIFLCNDPAKANLAKGFEVRSKRLEQLRDAVGREDREFKNRQTLQHESSQSRESKNRQAVQHGSSQSVDSVSDGPIPKSPPTAPAAMLRTQPNVIDPNAFERSPQLTESAAVQPVRNSNNFQRGRGSMRSRGRGSPMLGRAELVVGNGRRRGNNTIVESGPEIDPNSFERPRGGQVGRGGRRLWTPG